MPNQYGLSEWDDDRVAYLTERWKEGVCAREIAAALGVTRNAVIGKLHRLGCYRDREATPRKPQPQRRTTNRNALKGARILAKYEARRMETPSPIPSLNVPFLDREPDQCRAITDPKRYAQKCCGHPIASEADIYCAWHKALHFKPSKGPAR